MAKYRVVEPGPVQGGRAWQVGDVVELTDAQAVQYAGKVCEVDETPSRRKIEGATKTVLDGVKRTVRNLDGAKGPVLADQEPEGDGE